MYKSKIKVVAFDADDTLWINEPYFQETEQKFCSLLEDYASRHNISQELFKTEIANLTTYGYGVKGYILSMIEAAVKISGKTLSLEAIEKISRDALKIHRLHLETYSFRDKHLNVIEARGFSHEGTLIDHNFIDDRWFNSILHGKILK